MIDIDLVRRQLSPLDLSASGDVSEVEREYFQFYGIDFEAKLPSVEHQFGILSAAGFDVACHCYRQERAVATSYIVHGYFDHAGLYGHLIEYFLKANRNVVLIDLPGHGLSSGPRASIEAFADYVEALDVCVKQSASFMTQPSEFIGQSTGAAIIMQYMLESKFDEVVDTPARVVLLAPLVRPSKWPIMRFAHQFNRLFMSSIPRSFSNNSHDEEFLHFLRTRDPLQFKALPMQWVQAMKVWMDRFLAAAPQEEMAPLVIQGQQDQTVDWRYNITQIENKFPRANVQYLADGKHHLVNESEAIRQEMFALLDKYLQPEPQGEMS